MKQVDPKVYDKDFYERVYGNSITLESTDFEKSKDYYKELADLTPLTKKSFVVDFGCGNGNLAFYIYKRFNCKVLGIDYSPDAIEICKARLKALKKLWAKGLPLEFYSYNNDELPIYKNVDVVFFCDVVEHMYNDELSLVLDKMKAWNKHKNLRIAIHTDNNVYLNYVRPLLNLLFVLFGFKSKKDLQNEKEIEAKVHVNLTNPRELKRKMKDWGYEEISFKYTGITKNKIIKQLGKLSVVPFLPDVCYVIVSLFSFLSPSFFAIYRLNV